MTSQALKKNDVNKSAMLKPVVRSTQSKLLLNASRKVLSNAVPKEKTRNHNGIMTRLAREKQNKPLADAVCLAVFQDVVIGAVFISAGGKLEN